MVNFNKRSYPSIILVGVLFTSFLRLDGNADEKVKFSAQHRLRWELNQPDFQNSDPLMQTLMRTRLGVQLQPSDNVSLFIQAQDSRSLGSEGSKFTAVQTDQKNLDIHQAYVKIHIPMVQLSVGRKAVAIGSERYLSTLEWHNVARSYDGLHADALFGKTRVQGVALLITDDPDTRQDWLTLYGLHVTHSLAENLSGEVFGFLDQSGDTTSTIGNHSLFHPGIRVHGNYEPAFFDGEFIYQFGEINKNDVSAFFIASRLGVILFGHSLALGLDLMTGDDGTNSDINNYMPTYWFLHPYLGNMDYFPTGSPVGIMDFQVRSSWKLLKILQLKLDYHLLLPENAPNGNDEAFGSEIDFDFVLSYWKKSKLILGGGLFFASKGMDNTTIVHGPDPGYKMYLMSIFNY